MRVSHSEDTFCNNSSQYGCLKKAIEYNKNLFYGTGIDRGCGSGCLSITAAGIKEVDLVNGLDIKRKNISISDQNALNNGVSGKTKFILSDSFFHYASVDKNRLESMKNKTYYIISNPPSSAGDDGFDYRRKVFIMDTVFKNGGFVFLKYFKSIWTGKVLCFNQK